MVITGTTNITSSTISEIFYIPGQNGSVDVYIPIIASNISEDTDVRLVCDPPLLLEDYYHNIAFMYAQNQPQGNVWFLHITLDNYYYDSSEQEAETRTIHVYVTLITDTEKEPVDVEYTIIQSGCKNNGDKACEFEFCSSMSNNVILIRQDCSLINGILEEYGSTRTHVITQTCDNIKYLHDGNISLPKNC